MRGKVLGEKAEVGLEFQLMEIEFCGFQKTILEIVQVEEHAVHVKLRLRITLREVKPARSANLYVGQLADSAYEQFALTYRIPPAGGTSRGQCVKE